MKKNILPLLSLFLLLLAGGFFYSILQNQRSEISDLQDNLTDLRKQVATLQLLQARQRPARALMISRPISPAPANSNKDRLFKFLYEINGPASSENASVPKKIRYLPGQLIVQDFETARSDAFFELMGFLLDEDAVKKIELPAPAQLTKAERPVIRAIKTELLQFGVSNDFLSNSTDGKLRININDFNK